MAMKYKPLSDEELELRVSRALLQTQEDAMYAMSEAPAKLLEELLDTIADFDWEKAILEEDYAQWEEYVDTSRGDRT